MRSTLPLDELRHPLERPAFLISAFLNVVICFGAVVLVFRGGAWLFSLIPVMARFQNEIRAIALTAVFAPPLLVSARNMRLARVRGGSIKTSPTQFPLIHDTFADLCIRAGVEAPPTLWITHEAVDVWAHSFSAWQREYVVLGYDAMEADTSHLKDVWSFLLAREIGRLALGHTRWWDELFLAYVERLPWVRRPLRQIRSYSLDRIGAHLVPHGVRGLIIRASGRRPLPSVNVAEQIHYALSVGGIWFRLSSLMQEEAHPARRLQKLYSDGYFDLDADDRRFRAVQEARRQAAEEAAGTGAEAGPTTKSEPSLTRPR
ncbi:MAG: hypothetical protein P8188_10815 [Gemmatimonadota bacterium]